jgi:hypothetical protein
MATRATSISSLLNQIRAAELVLPDLQRDFVWEEDQIRLLFDSIMRDYPFGSLLIWQTQFHDVPYREFVTDFQSGMTFVPREKKEGKRTLMVLDGQQRLQSMLLGSYGTYDGKRLYFNITSGPNDTDADADDLPGGYRFEFWRDDDKQNRPKRLVRVADILEWAPRLEDEEIEGIVAQVGLEADAASRARRNIRRLRSVFQQSDLVPIETIDESAANRSQARSINEILEIFVRVNQGGTKLSRSDLMFSLIKSKWASARRSFDTLTEAVDPSGQLGIDKDFIIRGLLVNADVPVAFDVDAIGRHWAAMEPQFEAFDGALRTALDFCRDQDVRLCAGDLLKPTATLYPIIYYLRKRHNFSVPDGERQKVRTFLYFLLFNGFLKSKSPEARIRYLREVLQTLGNDAAFPLQSLLDVIKRRQTNHAIATNELMLNWNQKLALNIAQPGVCRTTFSWQSKPELDHIFPQSRFRERYPLLVDDIGNMAFLGKLRNIIKNDDVPWEYFAKVGDKELMEDFLVDRSLLAEDRFEQFVADRRGRILATVHGFLGR